MNDPCISASPLLERMSEDKRLWYESPDDVFLRLARADKLVLFMEDIKDLAEKHFTTRQNEMFSLFLMGKSLPDIARILGISRRSVHNAFWGKRVNLETGRVTTVWGGLFRKLRKLISKDPVLQEKYKEVLP